MKNLTPNGTAYRISLIVAAVVSIFVFVLEQLKVNLYVLIIAVFLAALGASYVGFRMAIEKFIYRKIKLIYKSIHKLKSGKNAKTEKVNLNRDVLSEVKLDVEAWAKTNKAEIDRLKGLESYQREFVGNVSHELKTPIFSIQGYILTLLEGGLEDPNINVNYLQRANKSVERMIALIEDLDEISKFESDIIEMDIVKMDLTSLINETIHSLEIKAQKANININFKGAKDKPVLVLADEKRISQVLDNLVVNSIKYGKDQGETSISIFDLDDNVLIEVEDNGQGIGEEHLSRLFERFYRTDKGRDRNSGGTGLGLSIVKHIIEAHHQTINVRSTLNVGSTFSFTLKKG